MRRLLCVITVCIMILSFCAGCSDNDRFGLGDNEEASVASSIVLSEADAGRLPTNRRYVFILQMRIIPN